MDVLLTKEEFVARYLRTRIVSGELPPGARIRQQQLADQLGVSATPVREALRSLTSEGWIRTVPHVGVSVAETNFAGLDEIYRLRTMVEGYLAEEAAKHVTPAVIDQLRALNEEFSEAYIQGNIIVARRLNYEFHLLVWEAAELPVTLKVANEFWAKFPLHGLGQVEGRGERTIREHAELIEALDRHDPKCAGEALTAHIGSGRNDWLLLASLRGDHATLAPESDSTTGEPAS